MAKTKAKAAEPAADEDKRVQVPLDFDLARKGRMIAGALGISLPDYVNARPSSASDGNDRANGACAHAPPSRRCRCPGCACGMAAPEKLRLASWRAEWTVRRARKPRVGLPGGA